MPGKTPFAVSIVEICEKDTRYAREAYLFVRQALDYTVGQLEKPENGPGRHVSGPELLEGMRQFAIREFGPMAATVFREWGLRRTEDFGEIVFNMVDFGILGRTEEDSREDFAGGFGFYEAFVEPYLPQAARRNKRRPAEV